LSDCWYEFKHIKKIKKNIYQRKGVGKILGFCSIIN